MPTYKDAHSVKYTLRSLSRQTLPADQFEVVLICDGPGEGYEGIEEYAQGIDLQITVLPRRRGRSAARNAGLAEAVGQTVLFLDSDCYAHPELLSRHVAFHEGQSTPRVLLGVRHELDFVQLGFVHRDEPVPDELLTQVREGTRFLGVLETDLAKCMETPWLFAHSNNVSVPAETLAEIGGFNEEFGTKWGWEDTEIFYRVYQQLGGDDRAFQTDTEAVCFHLPKYRDPRREYLDFFDNQAAVKRLYPHYDFELNSLRIPVTVAAKIRYYREVIRDCVEAKACRLAPVWTWVEPRLAEEGGRALFIGMGTNEIPLPDGTLTFDHEAPPSATNFHLIGTEIPTQDAALDVVVSVDFWRCLQWEEFCAFLRDATRAARTVLLVHTVDAKLPHQPLQEQSELDFLLEVLSHDFVPTKEVTGDITGITVRRR
ncbi:glycosyltransferase [Actinophytocola sp.]|uniref:glycosyltransferase n=1 Tax=Actinophytocola sp. TaxID=1872138 RepID=UPI002ED015CD